MKRFTCTPRTDWQKKAEAIGFGYHSLPIPYWDESARYEFSMREILNLENLTEQLWGMVVEAVQYVIDNKCYERMKIPSFIIPLIEKSWNEDHPSIYARFDFSYNGRDVKLLEINADTPTSLFEAAIVQWYWLQDYNKELDQWNSLHERLIDYWKILGPWLKEGPLYFGCVKKSLEDLTTVEYLRDCAVQAGLTTELIYMDDIGVKEEQLVDLNEKAINNLFKLYPWEFLTVEPFAQNLLTSDTLFIEPAWKQIVSNKMFMVILSELYPTHPCILRAWEQEPEDTWHVKKPIFGREGQNITLYNGGRIIEETPGDYDHTGYIYQELALLPCYNGNYPLIGSWIVGQQAAGMGVRESSSLITTNTSRFIPHYINQKVQIIS